MNIFLILTFISIAAGTKYLPDWHSIDARPLPLWYDDAKFGIFAHWGVYSVPAYSSEWIWWKWKNNSQSDVINYLDKHFHGQSYAEFASQLTAEHLDPAQFAKIVAASGAKYFVLTSKHHEGFTLWPSKTSFNWNAVDVGPKQDIVETLKLAFKKTGVHFGLYFSQMDWFHPLYISDGGTNKTEFVDVSWFCLFPAMLQQVSYRQMLEIIKNYEPEIVWSDGDWDRTPEYWKSKEFLAWLYNESPVKDKVVVNDRWGMNTIGKHGGFLTYNDHYDPGQILPRKWENCMTLDKKSWGYRRNMKVSDVHTVKEVLNQLVRAISCNGNLLLNIGPNRFGQIVPIFEDRLQEIGKFIKAHSFAIYGTKPWIYQNDSNIWYTSNVRNAQNLDPQRVYNPQHQKNTIIYGWIFDIPDNSTVILASVKPTDKTKVSVLGTNISVAHQPFGRGISVDLSVLPFHKLPSTDVIILKVEYAATSYHNPLKPAQYYRQNQTEKKGLKKLLKDYLRNNHFS